MSFFGESSHLSIGLDRLEEHLIRVVRSPSLTWIASNNMVHLFDSWIRSAEKKRLLAPTNSNPTLPAVLATRSASRSVQSAAKSA